MKTSRDIVTEFFSSFGKKEGWESYIADDIVNQGPMPELRGKAAFVEMSTQFLQGMTGVTLNSTLAEGNKVALTATYDMALLTGDAHSLHTTEIYTVENEKIKHILISFDTAAFNEFMEKMPQPSA